jgi:hypothetical protein
MAVTKKRRYRANQGGHAPGHLREAFGIGVDAALLPDGNWAERLGDVNLIEFRDPGLAREWQAKSNLERALWLCGQLWNCGDQYGFDTQYDMLPPVTSYGAAARFVRSELLREASAPVIELIEQMGEHPHDPTTAHLVACGLHSGFPTCCIVFFVKFWWPMMEGDGDPDGIARYRAMMKSMGMVEGPGYIPCPRCLLERNFVGVRRCSCARRRRLNELHYLGQ